jgi:hypothetical protein
MRTWNLSKNVSVANPARHTHVSAHTPVHTRHLAAYLLLRRIVPLRGPHRDSVRNQANDADSFSAVDTGRAALGLVFARRTHRRPLRHRPAHGRVHCCHHCALRASRSTTSRIWPMSKVWRATQSFVDELNLHDGSSSSPVLRVPHALSDSCTLMATRVQLHLAK